MRAMDCPLLQIEQIMFENQVLTRHLAKIQERCATLLSQRVREINQLNQVIEFLSDELRQRDQRICFLETKLQSLRLAISPALEPVMDDQRRE
ncbi:hypothetical protein NQT62_06790 [Limnobacter humi]|uniref:Uncharacterized protein n=1 Tax=Limnobacter humi TaxID=1778671 RepID=A0ABT1WF41_9BURK|nr:hypothetical protein [Limnobacter humi]MCQ8896143.1 hypothetical protein [Limnobacter humi]